MSNQDGVITRAQAVAAGMSSSGVNRRLASGEWQRLECGVYLRADRAQTPRVRLRSAVYGAGPRTVAHGPSAAWWHGLLDRAPHRHSVSIPRSLAVRNRPGVCLRRRDLHSADVTTYRHLPVTAVPLTVLEAAVDLPNGSVFLDRALQRSTTLPVLEAAHRRNLGRHGSAAATRLLSVAAEGGASEAERMLHRLLRREGVTGWKVHVVSCGYEIDVAFIRQRVAIEVDGWAWHRDAARFNSDVDRQNVLVNAGWHMLRFTWHQLTNDPAGVVAQVRRALHRSR